MIRLRQKYWFMVVAKSFLHTPYVWGGDDATGIDCSGMVVECLKSIGSLMEREDYTADGLWHKYQHKLCLHPKEGCLAFWGDRNKMTHVAICLDEDYCLTADGGGSTTHTLADAIKQNAFVKIRPILHRKNPPKGYISLF